MKVVLDTNVLVSGVFFGGVPGRLLETWRDGRIQIVLSKTILEEYLGVIRRLESQFPGVESVPVIEMILSCCELVSARRFPKPVCEDPADDKFIECALSSGTRFIISGDKHLLRLDGFRNLVIVRPVAFLRDHLRA